MRRAADRVPLEIRRDFEAWHNVALPPEDLFERCMNRIAASVAMIFTLQFDEVAILLLKDQGQLLRFAYPSVHFMGKSNLFPVWVSSIAGRVLASRRGRIDNDVSKIRHLDFYERIRVRAKGPLDIQKMITVPLLLPEGQPLGVMQVSRRAPSLIEAGPDFPAFDLLKLRDLGRGLAAIIREVVPANF